MGTNECVSNDRDGGKVERQLYGYRSISVRYPEPTLPEGLTNGFFMEAQKTLWAAELGRVRNGGSGWNGAGPLLVDKGRKRTPSSRSPAISNAYESWCMNIAATV